MRHFVPRGRLSCASLSRGRTGVASPYVARDSDERERTLDRMDAVLEQVTPRAEGGECEWKTRTVAMLAQPVPIHSNVDHHHGSG